MNTAGPSRRGLRTRIKICGITSVAAARAAADLGVDAIGLVLAPGSPRRLTPAQARSIAARLPRDVAAVAVFRDQSSAEVRAWGGAWVQLHGGETEAEADLGVAVIKGIPFDEVELRRWDRCPHVAAVLVDGAAPGAGRPFDHAGLAALMPGLHKPIILAGGLTPRNVGAAVARLGPWAVDVSSGVESAPGVKDRALMRAFCDAVEEADRRAVGAG